METINIKAFPEDKSQLEVIKAFLKALKIKFEVSKEKAYNPEFVEKVLQGDDDFMAGKGKKISIDELDQTWK